MKIAEAHRTVTEVTGLASDRVRNLAFAGIAVVWILSGGAENPTTAKIDDALAWPLFAFAGTLFLDVLQYVMHSALWGLYTRRKEESLQDKHGGEESEEWRETTFVNPRKLNLPAYVLFWLKVVALATGYLPLLVHLYHRLQ